MQTTNLGPYERFSLCFLVITCAKLVTGDYSKLPSSLSELSIKNKHPLLLLLDHHLDSKEYDSLEHKVKYTLSSFLNGPNQKRMSSDRYPLLEAKTNGLKFKGLYQNNQNKKYRNDIRYRDDDDQLDRVKNLKNRYVLDQQGSYYTDRHNKHKTQQDRNRYLQQRYRSKQDRNKNELNRHRSQQIRDRDLQDRYAGLQDRNNDQQDRQGKDANEIDKYRNLWNRFQQQQYNREKKRDTNKYSAENEAQYILNKYWERESKHRNERNKKYRYKNNRQDRQRHQDIWQDREAQESRTFDDRREKNKRLQTESPIIRSFLKMSNSFLCGARNECQDECDSNSTEGTHSCENDCKEKYECNDEESEEDESCDDECHDKVIGVTKGTLVEDENY